MAKVAIAPIRTYQVKAMWGMVMGEMDRFQPTCHLDIPFVYLLHRLEDGAGELPEGEV